MNDGAAELGSSISGYVSRLLSSSPERFVLDIITISQLVFQ